MKDQRRNNAANWPTREVTALSHRRSLVAEAELLLTTDGACATATRRRRALHEDEKRAGPDGLALGSF
jgi:hypothetical protein